MNTGPTPSTKGSCSVEPAATPPYTRVIRIRDALLKRHNLIVVLIMAWVANFLHFERFGYYEDDWYYFPTGIGQPLLTRFRAVLPLMKSFFQGRPLLLGFETLFAHSGRVGMTLPYIVVFALFAVTTLLFYRVLRMRFPRLFCTIAVLLFVLSPLTTIRQNLMIGCVMGPAFICALSAILLRRRYPVVSYVLATCTLFTYESVFMLILAAPLFDRGGLRRKRLQSISVHFGVCLSILVGSVILRRALGEGRMLEATAVDPVSLLLRVITSDLYYSARSFVAYAYAARTSWKASSLDPYVYLIGFWIWSLIALSTVRLRSARNSGASGFYGARRIWWLWNGCAFSLVLIVVGYLTIYFQTSGNFILYSGRDTRFSASAVPGSSMFLASLLMLFELTRWRYARWVARGCLAVMISAAFVYSFVIQDDYVRAWDYEKNFLSQVVVQTGADPQPGLGPADRPGSIGWQRFGLVVSLKCLGDWSSSPEIIFAGSESWRNHLEFGPDGNLHWTQREPGSTTPIVVPGRIIVLDERRDGLLTRLDKPVMVDGRPIQEEHPIDIALGKPASQSSTFGTFSAIHGVDGHFGSMYSGWAAINDSGLLRRIVSPVAATALAGLYKRSGDYAGFHTNYEPSPWWEVDLGRPFVLQRVRIYNGQPAFYQRAASLRLLLSSDDKQWKVVYDNRDRVFGPEALAIDLPSLGARYVRVQLAKPNWLHLEQVEVFGQ
jgi:F5/8 type C domain